MKQKLEQTMQLMLDKNLITAAQLQELKTYNNLNIFSLHNELKALLYLSILLFTSGIGILIYQNIDSIGHTVILALLLLVTLVCFYISFKHAKGFQKELVTFENPLYDYLVLTSVLLTCIFIGYVQFQYQLFGQHYGLATLVPTSIAFFCGYYFDNKSVLSIAITGLVAYIGLTIDPKSIVTMSTNAFTSIRYAAIALGIVLLLWSELAAKQHIKKHFNIIYVTFALHLISIACITAISEPYWFVYVVLLAGSTYYFYDISFKLQATSLFVFTLLYAFIGCNQLLSKGLDILDISQFYELLTILSPFYLVGSIILFIKLIKNFNKKIDHDSLR